MLIVIAQNYLKTYRFSSASGGPNFAPDILLNLTKPNQDIGPFSEILVLLEIRPPKLLLTLWVRQVGKASAKLRSRPQGPPPDQFGRSETNPCGQAADGFDLTLGIGSFIKA